MFSKLRVDPHKKCLVNLPEGWVTLFLARTRESAFLFGAVIGLRDKCLPTDEGIQREIGGFAKVLQFTVENIHVLDVYHGHKYPQGGGLVDVNLLDKSVIWAGVDECGRNEFFGERIPLADVLVTL
ncbi:MAG: hypothetical protein UY31_C0006G0021 [Candidatus Wolfebacteria bacterium GW2011_GWE1_48_7]|uniref:Uncharacterized protein n=3 Tax=Candidatus Wolfeibacteriota TaxID=1752735 RepID=A0A0G1WFA8_9BACT|nr:MAG: hypothetical protein UX70_C0001G0043 [Candidatus Wolfebacteria bacterium GW2011_GWB1_47_1]KKU36585.1 MAG: hypothetical protein UX49_C0013G0027 [Candidatus Wolfebacteria bacterium GW2011_GWC2_46_275]KKU41720.1 MAG: hypothetical protein UX58_C0006G0029 [Candidatus Wolfebacteria bacterium GW2011_GWB2_46_69]KKU53986.1 MAG: hypothetical protein UX76_C0007G0045 [Candidatus Wolfebacteria bacterium GW2011_GWC1_47_103]KKU59012.1 MAG: hypothetical protein UX83_C0009G0028 [Candidatus Wolfebacteria